MEPTGAGPALGPCTVARLNSVGYGSRWGRGNPSRVGHGPETTEAAWKRNRLNAALGLSGPRAVDMVAEASRAEGGRGRAVRGAPRSPSEAAETAAAPITGNFFLTTCRFSP